MNSKENASQPIEIIKPNWPCIEGVEALSTTRKGGASRHPWDSLNLATHVNDNPYDVKKNRELLNKSFALPNEPTWLEQVHSNEVVRLTLQNFQDSFQADATYTTEKGIVCCVMTADCVPILIRNAQSTWVAAVHAGWKGIANGILKKVLAVYLNEFDGDLNDLQIWIGPAISGNLYQVGQDVKDAFIQQDSILEKAFTANSIEKECDHYWLDSSKAAQLQLVEHGITEEQISTEDFCTYEDAERFFSYRRDGLDTGRMASLIWLT